MTWDPPPPVTGTIRSSGGPGSTGLSAAFTAQFGIPSSPPLSVPSYFTQLTSVLVPFGSYIVTAKVVLTNNTTGVTGVTCVLTQSGSGSLLDRADGSLADRTGADTLILHAAVQITAAAGEHVRVSCQTSSGSAYATYQQLTAIQLGSLTAPGP